jgi:uncharacterized protein (DUF427 family)
MRAIWNSQVLADSQDRVCFEGRAHEPNAHGKGPPATTTS